MALYDYKCTNCGLLHTIDHSVHEAPAVLCDECGGPCRKLYSSPAAVFPGGGWGKDAR